MKVITPNNMYSVIVASLLLLVVKPQSLYHQALF
jgi:hypothetical protein